MLKEFRVDDWIPQDEEINIITIRGSESKSESMHTHEFAEFVYISGGKGIHRINDVAYPVKRGNFLFINYNQTHTMEIDGEQSYVNILIKPEFFNKELMNSENIYEIFSFLLMEEFSDDMKELSPVVLFSGNERIEFEEVIAKMQKEFEHKEFGYRLVLKGCLNELFTYMFRCMQGRDIMSVEHMNAIMPDVISYINEHCMDKITLQEIASNCFYDKAHLSRIFKKHFGISPLAYIQERRLDEAANLLTTTEYTVEKICDKVGYSTNRKQFYKLFEKRFGITPGEYKKLKP